MDDTIILTDQEKRCLSMLAEAGSLLQSICFEPFEQLEVSSLHVIATEDWNELAPHLHILQKAVLAQATARIFPGKYRLLGGAIPEGYE